MYITLLNHGNDLPIITNAFARKSVEIMKLESSAKWMRDNNNSLHITNPKDKYSIIIECCDIAMPFIDAAYIGKKFEINCKTRVIAYFNQDEQMHRAYQKETLAYHPQMQDGEKAINAFESVEVVTCSGMYSYRPILQAYLRSVESIRDDSSVKWKIRFEEI